MKGFAHHVAQKVFMFFWEMCGGVVEDAKFLFIFVRVSAAGRVLPANLAWWILWR